MVAVKLQEEFAASERRECQVLDQPRTSQRYQAQPRPDEAALVKRMLELVRAHPRYGYRFITAKLRQEGWQVNGKRVYSPLNRQTRRFTIPLDSTHPSDHLPTPVSGTRHCPEILGYRTNHCI